METEFCLLTCKMIGRVDDATVEEGMLYRKHFGGSFGSLIVRRWGWRGRELLDVHDDLDNGVIAVKDLEAVPELVPVVMFTPDQITMLSNNYPELVQFLAFLHFIRRTDRPTLEPENESLNNALDLYDQSDAGLKATIIETGARKLYHLQTTASQTSKPVLTPTPTPKLILPASKPIIPGSKPIIPASKPIIPGSKLILPGSKPIIPASKPIIPASKPVVSNPVVSTPVGERSRSLVGQTIVFYGFQSAELKADIEARGGKVTKSLSGVTTFFVMKDLGAESANVQRAEEMGIALISRDDFIDQYIK